MIDTPPAAPARLLVRAPNWLGDAVMALPALAGVRAAFPSSVIGIAAPASIALLFDEGTTAAPDEVIALDEGRSEVRALAAGRFDAALLLPNSFRSAWTARRANIPERWGYSANLRSRLLTRAVSRPSGKRHQSAYYLELARGLGIPAPDALPRVTPRAATVARAVELLSRSGIEPGTVVVGFAPGAAYGHAKRWPPARVAALVRRVFEEAGAVSVLVGAAGDREAGREIESSLSSGVRLVNLIGRTDLRLLTGVLARCRAFVSNDSGAMHLAAALGVRVAAIFGPTDERATAPMGDHDVLIHQVFCRPCMLRDCPIDHRCMKGITVDAVFAALKGRL
ncbi:MAG: lipopolysaccharide heptosyltransferase II [Acidobacteria bacterium RIFCSPLOWO2_02_FULL_67_36]|nr:MAG: lipopolysaccharide heptosyltransferase II [Acidobacteria bacterium RIFCSPLOWO2_02_FULL_67_36]OFW21494.1 MAG: lipopolysaccharide heptosyltransferase II [Acidobacteria bacterium RIFCSPLOWO2_12_FULL_66_21]